MENNGGSLAKISLGINVALIIAVIILFVKMPGSGAAEATSANDTTTVEGPALVDDGQLRIGYFQADSLNSGLLEMKELEDLMAQSQQNAEAKMRSKEQEIQRWQESWQSAGSLLPSEQEKYAMEAQQKQIEIAQFEQEVQMTLASEQEGYMFTLISRISSAAKEYAEKNGFDYILSYQLGQNVYYGSPNFDITEALINQMNINYTERTTIDAPADGEPTEGAE